MALFKEKEKITRKEFRDTLRKKNPVVPGTYKRLFSFEEREKMEERLFGKKKTGGEVPKKKFKRLIKEIGKDKYKAPNPTERRRISKKIRFLKRLGGM